MPVITSADLPVHIGIIMDGNGRWAQKKNLSRTAGHKQGLETAREIVRAAARIGIPYLTLYVFSTENWKRAQEEVGFLMGLITSHLRSEFEFYKKEQVRVLHLGNKEGLQLDVRRELESVQKDTAQFTGMNLVLAINYGGRDEILRAIQKICLFSKKEETNPIFQTGGELPFCDYFDLPELPNADLIIRTGGEKRLSNFLLWHSAYAELEFSDILWPDYTPDTFYTALADFQKRHRRFGGVTGNKNE